MKSAFLSYFVYIFLFNFVIGSSINFEYSPPSLRFGKASTLWLSELDQVISASLGYTVRGGIWTGLTVASPFGYPDSCVILDIKSDGVNVRQEGTQYSLIQDTEFDFVLDSLEQKLKAKSQKALHFEKISLENRKSLISSWKAELSHLNLANDVDDKFVREMEFLPSLSQLIAKNSSKSHGGQDIIYINITSFQPLIAKYEANSSKVNEAKGILRKAISQLMTNLRSFYDDRIVFISVLSENQSQRRVKRQAPTSDVKFDQGDIDINLVNGYSDDYPVVFNIVLFLAIMMIGAVIAASAAMAFMDPGHDSIIYRMTNPRMKKD